MSGFCTQCGAKLEDDANFCVECGFTAVREAPQHAPAPQPVVMQPPVPQVVIRQGDSANKGVIVLLLVIIVMLALGGGYLYMDNNKQQPMVAALHQTKSPADKPKKNDTREYAVAAVGAFRENEESLAALAAAINSGGYSQSNLLNMVSDTMNKVNTRRSSVQQKSASADAAVTKEVNEMFDIEAKRVECMRQGIQGNTDRYRIGGEYYDQFQVRFEALKGRYGL